MSSSTISLGHTATDDLKFALVDVDLWASEINIHIVTNNAKYGTFDVQEATVTTAEVLNWKDTNIRDWFFKNAGAGSNTTIYLTGTRMTEARKKELGIV